MICLRPDLADYQRFLIEGYGAGAKTANEKIAGRPAFVAENVREQKLALVAVLDGPDVVLMTSPSLKALRRAAGLYFP